MKRVLFLIMTLAALAVPAYATAPTADSFSSTASTVGAALLQLQGADADGTALVYAVGTSPSHGTLSGLITATGYVVYTPTASYTGADSFTYTVTSGGATTSPATVTLTVTNAKTRIVDHIMDSSGTGRPGIVTFVLTQAVYSPAGLIPASAWVSGVVASDGAFDVSIYPSTALSPQSYYQLWFQATGSLRREYLGTFAIPATSATSILIEPYRVLTGNLNAQYQFMSTAAINALTTGLAGSVTAFNGRTGAITPATNDYTWAQINKATSSLADITTRSASDLSSGTVATARLGSGTANSSTYLRGDGAWTAPSFVSTSGTTGNIPYISGTNVLSDSPILRYGSGTIGFPTGTAAAPSTSDQTTGTRLLMYPGATGEHLGLGVESGKLWFNVGAANAYKYYWAASTAQHHTVTPGQYLVTTSSSTFTLDYHTSATPSTAAMIIKTNADTVRITTNDTAVWDFQSNVSFRPVEDLAVDIGDSTHRVINLFSNYARLGTGIKDSNGNLLLGTTATTSSVNYFQAAGGATGTGPYFSALGSDSNIPLNFKAKGSGAINFRRGSDDAVIAYVDTANARLTTYALYGVGDTWSLGSTGNFLNNASVVSWFSGSTFASGSFDLSLARGRAGVVSITDGSTGGGTYSSVPISPSQITSNQNNYNPGGAAHYLRLNTDASRNITGLTFSTAQVDGQTHVIVNVGSTDLVLKHQDTNSTAANRFLNSTGADITLTANQMADCWYDATTARWRVSKRN